MDITKVTDIDSAIDFFNEEIAGPIVTADGRILKTPIIEK